MGSYVAFGQEKCCTLLSILSLCLAKLGFLCSHASVFTVVNVCPVFVSLFPFAKGLSTGHCVLMSDLEYDQ